MTHEMTNGIRRAEPGDVPAIVGLVEELAEYEKLREECRLTPQQLHTALFGPDPALFAHVAVRDGVVVGCALWFLNFSTWDGVAGLYLEDLYVRPAFRRRGLARKLLSTLAGECIEQGYTRMTWAVLNWNVNAIALYDAVGGKQKSEWITYRVSGPELSALAES